MVFYGYLDLFPPGYIDDQFNLWIHENPDQFKRYTYLYTVDGVLNGRFDIAWDAIKRLVMPVFTQVVVCSGRGFPLIQLFKRLRDSKFTQRPGLY